MKKKILPISIIAILVVVGVVGYMFYNTSSKPSDVSEEFWEKSSQVVIYINKLTNEDELIPSDLVQSLDPIIETEKENEIYRDLLQLTIASSLYGISKMLSEEDSEAKVKYNETYSELISLFGKNKLKENKLDMSVIDELISVGKMNAISEQIEAEENFKKTTGVSLTGKEVQYNMSNNLDQNFYLAGEIKLCDYYNYGYTNESDFFCGHLTPFDGSYSDSWYLYFSRKSFDSVYQSLMSGDKDYHIIAKINSRSYRSNQGNMAVVQKSLPY